MVRLYKDPNGETVFTAHEEVLQITTAIAQGGQLNQLEVADLRKHIKKLEDTIAEYNVHISENINISYFLHNDNRHSKFL